MSWITLDNIDQLDALDQASYNQCVLIFKHSTRCSISDIALSRLKGKSTSTLFLEYSYCLDVIKHRDISNEIAHRYQVHHETPQVLMIKNGDCFYEASHLDILPEEINEQIPMPSAQKGNS
ncbi:MAG: bacillithiol system redox-active protein YtxJ [Saprospiraceae bacterium]